MKLKLPVFPEKNDPRPLVIYHGNHCPDGFAAALAAWLYFGGQAEFVGLDHDDVRTVEDLPELRARAVYVLDFAFSEAVLRDVDCRAAKLVLLDHHLSAAEKLSGFQCRCGAVHFDVEKAGARLAWEFFYPDEPLPDLVRYVEDRDIWVWQYPESSSFLASLDMEPFEFARWHAIAKLDATGLAAYITRGEAMDAKFKQLAVQIAQQAHTLRFNGVDGWMVNAPGVFHSEVGHLLCQRSGSFALMWTLDRKGQVKCGLRSRGNFSCIALAESMGGGGHAQAAAFRMPYQRLTEMLGGTLNA
ncbi:MAG: phosphoesterase [Rhodoferax sp.]|uniref:DHH family phosphoesterase n=1 Tax=Rhodoferax sp. TaxID=50421 RepID=UPI001B3CBF98|nr:DHHA1 domain-containing protein [Rhodoferax sp.]MBP9904605.1 phosphoesterase [Rhodoferax sp.]